MTALNRSQTISLKRKVKGCQSHWCSGHSNFLDFYRFPNIACELLTSDVSIINDKLGGDESLLEILYHFLEQDPPLNPLLASFFSKTIGNLIARKTEQVPEDQNFASGLSNWQMNLLTLRRSRWKLWWSSCLRPLQWSSSVFQLITFLKKKEGFIGLVLKHIDASAMMDLLLRLISCVEPAPLRQEVLHVSCPSNVFLMEEQIRIPSAVTWFLFGFCFT